jgi:hypothetical protein
MPIFGYTWISSIVNFLIHHPKIANFKFKETSSFFEMIFIDLNSTFKIH